MFEDVMLYYKEDIDAIEKWSDTIYDSVFRETFQSVRDLFTRMESESTPITDSELEYIITQLPLELFTASEGLNKLRLELEVVKLKNSSLNYEYQCEASSLGTKMSSADKSLYVKTKMVEYELVKSAYSSVISRVENELSFSRELIMGAKKVWDSRRQSEQTNPISEINVDLPDYSITPKPSNYIK